MQRFKPILISATLAIALILSACHAKETPGEDIIGHWSFVTIEDEGGNQVKSIAPGDYMNVRKDQTFIYELTNENIASSGNWEIDRDGDLIYTYDNKDGSEADRKERKYHIEEVTDSSLIISEKGVNYKFKRDKEQE